MGRSTAVAAMALCLLAPPAWAGGRALLIGDSNIYGALGAALEVGLQADGWEVVRRGKPGSGLSRPDYFDWPAVGAALVERHSPDVVIVMFGGNDAQRVLFTGPPRRARVHWRYEHHWRFAYGQRVRALAWALRGRDGAPRRVFVLGPTNRRNPKGVAKLGRIREVQAAALRGLDQVSYVDMFPLSSDPGGHYLRSGLDLHGRAVRYRRRDGRHLTDEGGVEVARRLLEVLLDQGLDAARAPTARQASAGGAGSVK